MTNHQWQSDTGVLLKKSNLIVVIAAVINVLLIGAVPKYFSGESFPHEPMQNEKHKSILISIEKGLPITQSEQRYIEEKTALISEELHKLYEQRLAEGNYQARIQAKSILNISLISLTVLALLSFLNFFGSAATFVYFSIPSLLIFLFSPMGSSQIYLIILANMSLVYICIKAYRYFLKKD